MAGPWGPNYAIFVPYCALTFTGIKDLKVFQKEKSYDFASGKP